MTRGRLSNEAEAKRSEIEGDLALLGNLRVYCQLVDERVRAGVHVAPALLSPVLDDTAAIDRLAVRLQRRLDDRLREDLRDG